MKWDLEKPSWMPDVEVVPPSKMTCDDCVHYKQQIIESKTGLPLRVHAVCLCVRKHPIAPGEFCVYFRTPEDWNEVYR